MNKPSIKKGKKIRVKPVRLAEKEADWHWSYTLMLTGLFVGGGLTLLLMSYTLITWTELARIYLVVGLGILLIPFRWYRNSLGLERLEFILMSLMGIAPIALTLFLGLNMVFAKPVTIATYRIEKLEYSQSGWTPSHVIIHLEGKALEDYQKARTFDLVQVPEVQNAQSANYHLSNGGLGFSVLWEISFN